MSHSDSAVPYASTAQQPSPMWWLFRLGLILWASITLLRHGLYWTNLFSTGGAFAGGSAVRAVAFASIECILLILFLIAAIQSPRGTRSRFSVLGGLGGAFVAIVVIGALADSTSFGATTPSGALRLFWMLVAKLQVAIFPLLCLIGLMRGVSEE